MHNPCGGTSHPPPPPHIPSKNHVVYHPILQPCRRAHDPAHSPYMLTNAAAAAVAWLRRRRIRYLFLLLCSPLLLLLLCAALPFLCAAELCLRIRLWRKLLRRDSAAADRLRRCEEGFREEEQQEKSLLHRYLEDQLFLVGSMYECGDDDDDDNDDGEEEEEASRIVEDVERLGSSTARNPLLR
ncbi:hypothetical protein PHAVU_005G023800 [Phaseolus vulgaris]|uniref:Uncharacterized protein n=1 Tax=Phaseolus vulgaris TaxID=3885 RepID=V7BV47_PHAVU|nr:hypothetical protein PHAVU_005G023800g [Phaseolus vulgaris]ESW20898.1 hypothetical protein PHAVU_005G023800g [Phaseolus vulgaris]